MTSNLTNLQHELLKLFHYDLNEKQLLEIRKLLSDYFAANATSEMDSLWESKSWSEETMKQWAKDHTRTPRKS